MCVCKRVWVAGCVCVSVYVSYGRHRPMHTYKTGVASFKLSNEHKRYEYLEQRKIYLM